MESNYHIQFSAQNPLKVCFLYSPFPTVKEFLVSQFRNIKKVDLIFPEDISEENLIKIVPEMDVLVSWNISAAILEAAINIRLVISPYTGIDHMSRTIRKLFENPSFLVVNAHGVSELIAQHGVAMILGITNHLVIHHKRLSSGIWIPGGEGIEEDAPSIPLSKKVIGLFGYGHINRKVHDMMVGFDTKFAILRRSWEKNPENYPTEIMKFTLDNMDEFLKKVDILVIAAPLTHETKHVIGKRELELLGKDSILVNIGRADIVKEQDLFDALKEKIIARAALDVWYIYHPELDSYGRRYPYSCPFHELENVLVSPHRADSPFDDMGRWDDIIENIKRFADGRTDLLNIVDIKIGY